VLVVVGLGNPGEEYRGTRHNAGFEVVDRLAARHGGTLRRDRTLNAETARVRFAGRDALLVQPLSYMNLSGAVARRALERAGDGLRGAGAPGGVDAGALLVVCDDFALPLGTLRLRASGSSGGHNGLEDVEAALGTRNYPRLRIGVGPCTRQDPKDFVLGRFAKAERPIAEESFDRAADAVESWAESGVERTMARFNRGPEGPDGGAAGRTET
jgi:PTH1 family peptidyl-tRNA hydrolase